MRGIWYFAKKNKPQDVKGSAIFLHQNAEFTIDFIANNTALSKQWIATVSCSTPEIKIDSMLK